MTESENATQILFNRMAVKLGKSESTIANYSSWLRLWTEYSKLTMDETVAKWKKEAKADYEEALDQWDKLLDNFIAWQTDEKKIGRNTAVAAHAAVKSLIKYNCRLKLAIGTPHKEVQETIEAVTLDEFKLAFNAATEAQRWQLCGLKDSGMSREDFVELTVKDLRGKLDEKFAYLKVVRSKEDIKYETFLGPNALDVLRTYLKVRTQRGEKIDDETPLTISEKLPHRKMTPQVLTQSVSRLGEKVGLALSPHRIRKLFETRMSTEIKAPLTLKYWMGHKISGDVESHYIIPNAEEQQKLYEGAYKTIDITGGLEDRVKAIEAKVEQIQEGQLLERLKQGWKIAYKLENGELIVQR